MEEIKEAYERFNRYYREHSGIYIYPEFANDLEKILDFIATFMDIESGGTNE